MEIATLISLTKTIFNLSGIFGNNQTSRIGNLANSKKVLEYVQAQYGNEIYNKVLKKLDEIGKLKVDEMSKADFPEFVKKKLQIVLSDKVVSNNKYLIGVILIFGIYKIIKG